jgi:serine/threonine protein kinase
MALEAGRRLGSFEILAPLGAGGMGEVYRATDTKLVREVAIKVLRADVTLDAKRLRRFEQEARLLASLNHPHIAAIHGFEEAGGQPFLVLELVEGEDLKERLARGAIVVDEALEIARQIAEALEGAHDKGIVHRDLKPANVKLTPDGKVKILDFGLAKAWADPVTESSDNQSEAPTLEHTGTLAGVVLGTAAYMSPEQAQGKPVDKRADIWAFGAVLFEMLTGQKLFAGATPSNTLAAVLTREPDWTLLPSSTPPGVRRLLARCLEREPRDRLRDIGDARPDLDGTPDTADPGPAPERSIRRILPWGLAATALVLAGWAMWSRPGLDLSAREVTKVDIALPPHVEPIWSVTGGAGVSSDGRVVLMCGAMGGVRRLFVRRLDRAEASEIPGSENVNSSEFSPDGTSVAFTRGDGSITRVSLADQRREVVATGADLAGAIVWSRAGIIFRRRGALQIVSPEGGRPRALTALDAARGEVVHDHATVPPGGHHVLFSSVTTRAAGERIEAVSLDGGARSVVVERATSPVWSPTGHLLFARDGAVLAVAFDPLTATTRGDAIPVIPPGVVARGSSGGLGLRLSSTGTLLYPPVGFQDKQVVSVGRDGATLGLGLPFEPLSNPRISPDGRRLLFGLDGTVVEMLDLARGTRARLIGPALGTNFPAWSADGSRVVFRRFNAPFWAAADGSGEFAPLPAGAVNDFPTSRGPDPDSVIIVRIQPETSGDVFLMSIGGAFEPRPLIVTPAYDGGAQLAPDDRWLLYQSNASGQHEIYVRRYPGLDRQWQVSEGGGVQASWSRSGQEIYYRSGRDVVAVSFDGTGAEPALGTPTALFPDDYEFGAGISIPNYDVMADGRFVMLRRAPNGGKLRIVVNWTEELKGILAEGGVR